jgi:hypothetical protein
MDRWHEEKTTHFGLGLHTEGCGHARIVEPRPMERQSQHIVCQHDAFILSLCLMLSSSISSDVAHLLSERSGMAHIARQRGRRRSSLIGNIPLMAFERGLGRLARVCTCWVSTATAAPIVTVHCCLCKLLGS